jgi:iron(III) transport system permease protein
MTTVDVPQAPASTIVPTTNPDKWLAARHSGRRLAARLLIFVLVAALAVLILRPLYETFRLAFEDGAQGFRVAADTPGFWSALWATVWLAVGSTALALVLGVLLAWFAMRLPRGFGWLAIAPVLPIVVPGIASVMGWIFILSPRVGYGNQVLRLLPWWSDLDAGPIDVFTLPWIVVITGLALTAFVYLFVSAGLRNVNSELIEAAQTSGSSSIGSFFRVTLPVLRPSLVYATAVCLVLALGQFTAPLLLGSQVGVNVLTTEILHFEQPPLLNIGAAAAIAAPLTLIGILFVVGQRVLLGNQARFVSQGGKSFRPIGRRSPLGAFILGIYALLAAVVPLIGLILVAFTPFWSGQIDFGRLTMDHVSTTLHTDRVINAIHNSLTFAFWAMVITLPLGFVISTLLVRGRRHRVLRTILDFIVALPLGVPAVIFGFGFLFAYNAAPLKLTGTSTVVVLVYITLMIPFATRLQLSGMIGLGEAHSDASAVSGAGILYTNVKVTIPMMRAAIGGAAALIFILLSNEFAASLFVRNINTNVMGTVLYDAYTNGDYPTIAVMALIMSVVTAAGLILALAIGGRRALESL